jgi:Tol biopolymer transport system component
VAFYSRDLPEGDLYVVRPDGTGLRQVTGDVATDRVPRWSPDGEWIAYFTNRGGTISVWMVRADGSENRKISDGGLAAWSPDGTRLLLNGILSAGNSWSGARVVRVDRPEELLSLPGPEAQLRDVVFNSWSPDGRSLAGMIGYSDQGVVAFGLEAGTIERLTTFGQWPVWLPDGRHVLFVSSGSGFHVVDSVTRDVRMVYSVTRDVLGPPRLSQDGRRMVYSRRTTEADIWLMTYP